MSSCYFWLWSPVTLLPISLCNLYIVINSATIYITTHLATISVMYILLTLQLSSYILVHVNIISTLCYDGHRHCTISPVSYQIVISTGLPIINQEVLCVLFAEMVQTISSYQCHKILGTPGPHFPR